MVDIQLTEAAFYSPDFLIKNGVDLKSLSIL